MNKESFEKLIITHLKSKNVDFGIINNTVTVYSRIYTAGNFNGKATSLITKAIKEALKLQLKRNKK
tara:strand:- start:281 stop:478 length:198 start_codon:yes stop_codon:yes gene_type:complete